MATATKTKSPTFTTSQSELSKAITAVMPAISTKAPQPILANLKLDIAENKLHLTAFDLSLSLQASAPIKSDLPAQSFCVPAKYFSDVIGKLAGDLKIAIEESCLAVSSKNGKYKIPLQSASDYPELPAIESDKPITLTGDVIRQLLTVAAFASTDESKQILCGVHLTFDDSVIRAQSTDGRQLGSIDADPTVAAFNSPANFVLPVRVCIQVLKLSNSKSLLKLQLSDTNLHVEIDDGYTIGSRLLVGQFPNIQQLIPRQFSKTVTIDRRELIDALDRISVVAAQSNNIVRFAFDSDGCTLAVDGTNPDQGREDLPCQLSGEPVRLSLVSSCTINALKAIDATEIQIKMNTPTSPIVVSGLSGQNLLCVIAPIQIAS